MKLNCIKRTFIFSFFAAVGFLSGCASPLNEAIKSEPSGVSGDVQWAFSSKNRTLTVSKASSSTATNVSVSKSNIPSVLGDETVKIVFEEGITEIPAEAFSKFFARQIDSIEFAASISYVGKNAFEKNRVKELSAFTVKGSTVNWDENWYSNITFKNASSNAKVVRVGWIYYDNDEYSQECDGKDEIIYRVDEWRTFSWETRRPIGIVSEVADDGSVAQLISFQSNGNNMWNDAVNSCSTYHKSWSSPINISWNYDRDNWDYDLVTSGSDNKTWRMPSETELTAILEKKEVINKAINNLNWQGPTPISTETKYWCSTENVSLSIDENGVITKTVEPEGTLGYAYAVCNP